MQINKISLDRLTPFETPFYYYDMELLNRTLQAAKVAADKRGFHIHYALKANFNDKVLAAIQALGFGADCVSGNEVQKSIDSGFPAEQITFAGVGKSDKEISMALKHQIFAFNVESIEELQVIDEIAASLGERANVSLRINPNVDAHTHHYITTGLDENKFGVPNSELEQAASVLRDCKHVDLVGLHFHVGSQITDMNVFKSLCVKVNEWKNWFEERGTTIKILNVGGGLGVDYHHPDENPIPDFEAYFDVFDKFLERTPQQEVHFELGRALVAQSGTLVSRVLYSKSGVKKNFLILDAGMTELMRPALYQAYHKIERLGLSTETSTLNYDVVGPICESSDCFGKEVSLPISKRGDLIAIRTAGAYGEVMASRYNLREEIRYVFSENVGG
ncbi:diaminopimelate decarboxylase [Sphingobacterium sp. DK4209]|uniref:Diaminopimelate decarboxylase n=1 Tax=Sphingobacterium zhuxiongii TaxID=2662364 RepID=A0A5Q0QAL3_9SPHI|nr:MULTISPECIES: diaminopimelate decarboxylase [unclassified Sphingobacterium]MVZ66707.1 diaminopimelate decarboxylase [Sphingobacterium sp. DK4209]QGA26304.1 diaminopimelate decarboxylase [Sphingobacterium sp. dk4302]